VTAADKACLRQKLGADAVEMESGVIHQTCLRRKIPCTTVRAISDTAREDLPFDFSKFARPDQSIRIPRLLLALAGSPGKLGPLLRLRRQCIQAADRLAGTLVGLV
jgi:nucleoside phosphorylase